MALAGNVIWWLTLGFLLGLAWFLVGILMYATVIGIPWGRSCFELGKLCLSPFGKDIVSVKELRLARANLIGDEDLAKGSAAMGLGRFVATVIWLPLGIVLAVSHVLHGLILLITIIGIPLGLQDFKIAGLSLFPVGKRVVTREMAEEVRRSAAREQLSKG